MSFGRIASRLACCVWLLSTSMPPVARAATPTTAAEPYEKTDIYADRTSSFRAQDHFSGGYPPFLQSTDLLVNRGSQPLAYFNSFANDFTYVVGARTGPGFAEYTLSPSRYADHIAFLLLESGAFDGTADGFDDYGKPAATIKLTWEDGSTHTKTLKVGEHLRSGWMEMVDVGSCPDSLQPSFVRPPTDELSGEHWSDGTLFYDVHEILVPTDKRALKLTQVRITADTMTHVCPNDSVRFRIVGSPIVSGISSWSEFQMQNGSGDTVVVQSQTSGQPYGGYRSGASLVGSYGTVGQMGSGLASAAMALQFHGTSATAPGLNDWLQTHRGYEPEAAVTISSIPGTQNVGDVIMVRDVLPPLQALPIGAQVVVEDAPYSPIATLTIDDEPNPETRERHAHIDARFGPGTLELEDEGHVYRRFRWSKAVDGFSSGSVRAEELLQNATTDLAHQAEGELVHFHPVLLNVAAQTHWVVGAGITTTPPLPAPSPQGTYWIKDPGYPATTLVYPWPQGAPNQFSRAITCKPGSSGPSNSLDFTVAGDVTVSIAAPGGGVVSYDASSGSYTSTIPGAFAGHAQAYEGLGGSSIGNAGYEHIELPGAPTGTYTVQVTGAGCAEFALTVVGFDAGDNAGIAATQGFADGAVTLTVDYTGSTVTIVGAEIPCDCAAVAARRGMRLLVEGGCQYVAWTAGNGDYNSAANWNNGAGPVPVAADRALFGQGGGNYQIDFGATSQSLTNQSLTVDGDLVTFHYQPFISTVHRLTDEPALIVQNGGQLSIGTGGGEGGGQVIADRGVRLEAGASETRLLVRGSTNSSGSNLVVQHGLLDLGAQGHPGNTELRVSEDGELQTDVAFVGHYATNDDSVFVESGGNWAGGDVVVGVEGAGALWIRSSGRATLGQVDLAGSLTATGSLIVEEAPGPSSPSLSATKLAVHSETSSFEVRAGGQIRTDDFLIHNGGHGTVLNASLSPRGLTVNNDAFIQGGGYLEVGNTTVTGSADFKNLAVGLEGSGPGTLTVLNGEVKPTTLITQSGGRLSINGGQVRSNNVQIAYDLNGTDLAVVDVIGSSALLSASPGNGFDGGLATGSRGGHAVVHVADGGRIIAEGMFLPSQPLARLELDVRGASNGVASEVHANGSIYLGTHGPVELKGGDGGRVTAGIIYLGHLCTMLEWRGVFVPSQFPPSPLLSRTQQGSTEVTAADDFFMGCDTLVILPGAHIETENLTLGPGGVIGGGGTIDVSTFVNDGTLCAGATDSTEVFTISNDYTQTAEGHLCVTLGSGQDKVYVNGSATLGGTLDVLFANPSVPSQQFTILIGHPVTGTFATVPNSVSVTYTDTSVVLHYTNVASFDPPVENSARRLAFAPIQPNPVRGTARFAYELPSDAPVSLTLFDVGGRAVRTLVDREMQTAGRHEVTWNGTDAHGKHVPSGVYLAKLEAQGRQEIRRFVFIE